MILWKRKDGGPESRVWAWGLELKSLFSVLLLKFEHGTRDSYHDHAFNTVSWVLSGALRELREVFGRGFTVHYHTPSWRPIFTSRDTFHNVFGMAPATWVLSFRGPWADEWHEYLPGSNKSVKLTHGRRVLNAY